MKRIEFRLSMPGRSSWNGKWSGDDRNYTIVRSMSDKAAIQLMGGIIGVVERSWNHHWDDGWSAQVTARVIPVGARLKKSDGFCGYEWMVSNILDHGDTREKEMPTTLQVAAAERIAP